jgi:EAL domain-containing protein (putative c-di-GMP-specific phosphodiesterase class I)
MLMADPARAEATLARLSQIGLTLSVDDFGTGYSSLANLKRLPVDVIKIDKSFVMEMAVDASDAAIVHSTIDLAHNLGLRVVAEGVESEAAWRRLRDLGCDFAQGYHLSRPLPPDAVTRLITERAALEVAPVLPQLRVVEGLAG